MQPDDVEALAGELTLTLKTVLAPVLARMAALEAHLSRLPAQDEALAQLRDRLVALETKVAIPAPVTEPVDLTPLHTRLAVIETKAASAPVLTPPPDLTPLLERLRAVELQLELRLTETAPILGAITELTKDASTVRERLAVVETRAPVPGPAGANGVDGHDGLHGKDGADGLGFTDLAVDFDGDRTVALRFDRDGVSKVFPIVLPFLRYQGVFQDGKAYSPGDTVTWAGSTWHANDATTTKPGDGSKAWTLIVKRGRDGKDGLDAPGALPVVLSPGALTRPR